MPPSTWAQWLIGVHPLANAQYIDHSVEFYFVIFQGILRAELCIATVQDHLQNSRPKQSADSKAHLRGIWRKNAISLQFLDIQSFRHLMQAITFGQGVNWGLSHSPSYMTLEPTVGHRYVLHSAQSKPTINASCGDTSDQVPTVWAILLFLHHSQAFISASCGHWGSQSRGRQWEYDSWKAVVQGQLERIIFFLCSRLSSQLAHSRDKQQVHCGAVREFTLNSSASVWQKRYIKIWLGR